MYAQQIHGSAGALTLWQVYAWNYLQISVRLGIY